jgi:hypothetical protein
VSFPGGDTEGVRPLGGSLLIGSGELGGKASGLLRIAQALESRVDREIFSGIEIGIPPFCVVGTDVHDRFVACNELDELETDELEDDRIAHAYICADLPPEVLGELRSLAERSQSPLAVRSSSLLEDALYRPFAGVYATKMIPCDQPDPDERFRRLVEAIKLVWASTVFGAARRYRSSLSPPPGPEKMAVIIQQVLGSRRGERFYPTLSGVARSRDYYPKGRTHPEDGVVQLALGLGKTIVDGGRCWSFSPALPKAPPPFNDLRDMMRNTQTGLWTIAMGPGGERDPLRENEYMRPATLAEADYDDTLRFTSSTLDARSNRLVPGTGPDGPRVVTFAPLLVLHELPLAELVRALLDACEEELSAPVEIEFAMDLHPSRGTPANLGFLQVRPLAVSDEKVAIESSAIEDHRAIVFSDSALGNGVRDDIRDLVFVRRDRYDPARSAQAAREVEAIDAGLRREERPYALISPGRVGTSDPWRGLPVAWSQIAGARAIVEYPIPGVWTEPSQGSHFFHNLTSLSVCYFTLGGDDRDRIDWSWLEARQPQSSRRYVTHVRTSRPLRVMVDGRSGRGVILHDE